MVFRRDSKVDAFQRQISALRHQLGVDQDESGDRSEQQSGLRSLGGSSYSPELPDLNLIRRDTSYLPDREQGHSVSLEPAPPQPAVPSIDTNTSVIAHSTSWNGNFESDGSLHIHGRVEGSLKARQDIFIAEEAEVDATVSAVNVTVAGMVSGTIECSDRFEVLARGRVMGDVRAPVIVVHEGAMIAGAITMSHANGMAPSATATAMRRSARGS